MRASSSFPSPGDTRQETQAQWKKKLLCQRKGPTAHHLNLGREGREPSASEAERVERLQPLESNHRNPAGRRCRHLIKLKLRPARPHLVPSLSSSGQVPLPLPPSTMVALAEQVFCPISTMTCG